MSILSTEWNVIFNIGIKCNVSYTNQKMRYFSSPWDHIFHIRKKCRYNGRWNDYMKVEDLWG